MIIATSSGSHEARQVAVWGAGLGLVIGIGLGSLRFGLSDMPDATSLGNFAFLVAYAMPFAVALGAIRLSQASMQVAVWLGCGALGLLGTVTAFSGVSLLLFPPGLMLCAAAIKTLVDPETHPEWPILPVSVWLVAIGILAFVSLFRTEDPHSWISGNTGYSVSDVISDSEGLMSLGIWAVGLVGLASMLWVWHSVMRT
jgi:hypothetical protein